jgi:hypothetical protein
MADLEKMIVVHPHEMFDGSLKCKPFIEGAINNLECEDSDIIILQAYKSLLGIGQENKKLEVYLDTDRNCKFTPSSGGEISKKQLMDSINGANKILLYGGIINQCHLNAFYSITNYVNRLNLHGIDLVIPFDGCYLQHNFAENDRGEVFNGVFIDLTGYEMNGSDSYTLREVATKKFGDIEIGSFEEIMGRRQINDTKDPTTISSNVREIFKNYFFTRDGDRVINGNYKSYVEEDQMRIHIY